MRINSELADHIQFPNNVGVALLLIFFGLNAVVATVAEPFSVGTYQRASIRDVIHSLSIYRTCRCYPFVWPVILFAGWEFVVHGLPKKLAVRLAKTHDDSLIARNHRIATTPPVGTGISVVCANKDLSISHYGVAVAP